MSTSIFVLLIVFLVKGRLVKSILTFRAQNYDPLSKVGVSGIDEFNIFKKSILMIGIVQPIETARVSQN